MTIAARIEKRLKTIGLKRSVASKRARLNETYVRDVIEGRVKNPRAEHLTRLAAVLGTTPEWLMEGRGPEQVSEGAEAESFQAAQTAWSKIAPRDREQALKVLKSFVREEIDESFEPEPPPPLKRRKRRGNA